MKNLVNRAKMTGLSSLMLAATAVTAADVKTNFAADEELKAWTVSGKSEKVDSGWAWQSVTIKFNSQDNPDVLLHCSTMPGAVGRFRIDNVRVSPKSDLKDGDFENKAGWVLVNAAYDSELASSGNVSVAAKLRKASAPTVVIQQSIKTEKNTDYEVTFDIIVTPGFHGEGRFIVFDTTHNKCVVTNYNDLLFSNIVKNQKPAKVLQLTSSDESPITLKRTIDIGTEGVATFNCKLNTEKFKGKVKILLKDAANNEELDTIEVAGEKAGWQNPATTIDFPSKVTVTIFGEGEGSVLFDSVAMKSGN